MPVKITVRTSPSGKKKTFSNMKDFEKWLEVETKKLVKKKKKK